MPKVLTRAEAIASGATRYYTGKPCKNGHVAERYTLHGPCVECLGMHRARETRDFRRAQRSRREG